VRGRDLRDVRHDAASRNGPAGPGPATDLAMILASSASTCAWTCSGRPSHRAGESSWPANKASCRAGAILRTRIGSPLPSFAAIRNEVNLLPFPGLHRQEHPNRPQPRSQPAARPPRPVPPPGTGGRHQAPHAYSGSRRTRGSKGPVPSRSSARSRSSSAHTPHARRAASSSATAAARCSRARSSPPLTGPAPSPPWWQPAHTAAGHQPPTRPSSPSRPPAPRQDRCHPPEPWRARLSRRRAVPGLRVTG